MSLTLQEPQPQLVQSEQPQLLQSLGAHVSLVPGAGWQERRSASLVAAGVEVGRVGREGLAYQGDMLSVVCLRVAINHLKLNRVQARRVAFWELGGVVWWERKRVQVGRRGRAL